MKICYIPLDDRPVVLKRVDLLAKACGFDIIYPNLELIQTHLDNQGFVGDKQFGNGDEIVKWMENVEADYYVICVDMITSGGLVNSRISVEDVNLSIKRFEKVFSLIKDKPTIFIDTIMRLTCTNGYLGFTIEDYEAFRQYGKQPRIVLKQPFTLNDVFDHYIYDEKMNEIPSPGQFLEHYFASRRRKALITDYLIKNKPNNVYYMLGVDDSFPGNTIQYNEVNYFKSIMNNGIVFCGIDELPLMGIARAANEYYQCSLTAKMHYVGGSPQEYGDEYDNDTIENGMINHFKGIGIDFDDNGSLDVVAYIYHKDENGSTKPSIDETVNLVNSLISKGKQVVLMDLSNCHRYGELEKEIVKRVRLSKLLGYSNWNTIANSIGLSLTVGVARYCYLIASNNKSDEADEAFIQLMTFGYLKDMDYKIYAHNIIRDLINESCGSKIAFYNFYNDQDKVDLIKCTNIGMNNDIISVSDIINNLKNDSFVTDLKDKIKEKKIIELDIQNYRYPWHRTFELDFDILCKVRG